MMNTTRNFHKLTDPGWVKRKRIHYRVLPEWADGYCLIVFMCSTAGLLGSVCSCFLLHNNPPPAGSFSGLVICILSIVLLCVNTSFFLKGLYLKFKDNALEAFYLTTRLMPR